MVEIQDPVIKDREDEFIADEISFLNFVVSDYSNPIALQPAAQANLEFDLETRNEAQARRTKFGKEADGLGKKGIEKAEYIKDRVGIY